MSSATCNHYARLLLQRVWGEKRLFLFHRVSQVIEMDSGQLSGHEYLVVGREMVASSRKTFIMCIAEMPPFKELEPKKKEWYMFIFGKILRQSRALQKQLRTESGGVIPRFYNSNTCLIGNTIYMGHCQVQISCTSKNKEGGPSGPSAEASVLNATH